MELSSFSVWKGDTVKGIKFFCCNIEWWFNNWTIATEINIMKITFITNAGKVKTNFLFVNNIYTKTNAVKSWKIKNAQGSVPAKLKGTKKISIENNKLRNIIQIKYPI